jgi:hypothetical protein
MRKPKEKWPVKELMVRRQCRLLKRWLRYVENLNGLEEEMVQVCEPETGKFFSEENELGSFEDLKHCQEGSGNISDCQVGRDENSRLSESLMDSEVSSIQQGLLMKMGLVDLIVCQESNGSIPYFQVGRDE